MFYWLEYYSIFLFLQIAKQFVLFLLAYITKCSAAHCILSITISLILRGQ